MEIKLDISLNNDTNKQSPNISNILLSYYLQPSYYQHLLLVQNRQKIFNITLFLEIQEHGE
jgi:hypothetical protein